jgi:hypothetical protein
MITNFEELSLKIQEEINKTKKLVNEKISKESPTKQTIVFSVEGEENTRKVVFKLVETENEKHYEFDYLAW